MKKLSIILIILISFNITALHAQTKKGYAFLTTIKAPNNVKNPHKELKNSIVRAMKLSESNKYLVVSYGSKLSTIVIYEIGSFKKVCLLRLNGVLELNNSYFSNNDSIFYLKSERYSSEYKKIDVFKSRFRKVNCNKTPRGCRVEEVSLNKIRFYTKDKKYYIFRSRKNRNDILILEKYE